MVRFECVLNFEGCRGMVFSMMKETSYNTAFYVKNVMNWQVDYTNMMIRKQFCK